MADEQWRVTLSVDEDTEEGAALTAEFFKSLAEGLTRRDSLMTNPQVGVERVPGRLREALDDLWGCIGKAEIDALQPTTVEIAQANHELLWHAT